MEDGPMLVLSRKVGEKIMIGDKITIVVQRVSKGRVAIAIEAPHSIPVLRGELAPFGVETDEEADPPANPTAPSGPLRRSSGPKRESNAPAPRTTSPNEHHATQAQPTLRSVSVLATR
jgi:carbon storage regulator